MSTKPLRQYFDVLVTFAESSYENVDKSTGLNLDKVRALYKEGCLTAYDTSSQDGIAFKKVSMSPRGAVMLAEWNSLLERSSIKGKILSQLEKLIWVAVGVVATVIGQFMTLPI